MRGMDSGLSYVNGMGAGGGGGTILPKKGKGILEQ